MELLPKVLKQLLCIIILVIMLSGCTDKKNLTGDNFSDIRAITIQFSCRNQRRNNRKRDKTTCR